MPFGYPRSRNIFEQLEAGSAQVIQNIFWNLGYVNTGLDIGIFCVYLVPPLSLLQNA